MSDERRREILANLQRERDIRRKRAQEIHSGQSYATQQFLPSVPAPSAKPEGGDKSLDMLVNINTEDFKDPNDILMGPPEDTAADYTEPVSDEINIPSAGRSSTSKKQDRPEPIATQPRVYDNELMKECLEYSTRSVLYQLSHS